MKCVKKKAIWLFLLKNKNMYPSFKLFQEDSICKDHYIGETERNEIIRWGEHNNPVHASEPA